MILDDVIQELQDALNDHEVFYGEKLEKLLEDLQNAQDEEHAERRVLRGQRDTLQNKLQELQGIEKFVEDVVGGKPTEVENKTTGAKRSVMIGDIVMFTDTMRNDHVALVLEIYGFPPGKVGLRTFGKGAAMDQYRVAEYSATRNGGAWRFID